MSFNQLHICGPANAQNQREQIALERQMVDQLIALSTIASQSQLRAKLEFAFSDVHQRPIYPVRANELVTRIVLIVLIPFDDISARISVGDAENSQRLLPEDGSALTLPCAFEAHPNYRYLEADSIELFLTPASSTQGRGVIYLYTD